MGTNYALTFYVLTLEDTHFHSCFPQLSNLPPQTDVRPLLRLILQITALPTVPLWDLCTVAGKDRRPDNTMATEWCLCVPPGAPGYIGPDGGVAMSVEEKRVSVLVCFVINLPFSVISALLQSQMLNFVLFRSNSPAETPCHHCRKRSIWLCDTIGKPG